MRIKIMCSSLPPLTGLMRLLPGILLLLVTISGCTPTPQRDYSGMTFSDTPLVGKIVWNDLVTEDLDAAKRFYGELFGWSFEDSSRPFGPKYVLARLNNVYVAGLVPVTPRPDGARQSRWLPYISVGDVDAAAARARNAGADIAVSPRDTNVARVAVIIDPEGAVIGLARSDIGDPDDQTTAAGPGRVVLTELLADHPDQETNFYTSVVGVQANTIERRGGEYTQLISQGMVRAGIFKNPSDQAKPRWLTFFGVADPATAAARAQSLGGEILLPVSPDLREGSIAVVTDPAGAILVLQKWNQ